MTRFLLASVVVFVGACNGSATDGVGSTTAGGGSAGESGASAGGASAGATGGGTGGSTAGNGAGGDGGAPPIAGSGLVASEYMDGTCAVTCGDQVCNGVAFVSPPPGPDQCMCQDLAGNVVPPCAPGMECCPFLTLCVTRATCLWLENSKASGEQLCGGVKCGKSGYCEIGADGSEQCSCYGIAGGCAPGYKCTSTARGCDVDGG